MYVDDGTEFKGACAKWFKDNNVVVRVAQPARHRQQSIVENKNKIIGKKLFKRMLQQEVLTGVQSNSWVSDLPEVINEINKQVTTNNKKRKPNKYADIYRCSGDACDVFAEGTKVRVALDAPRDFLSGKRLHGTFRETDVRWSLQPHIITMSIVQPGSPARYYLDNNNTVAYTKSQLMPFANETVQKQGYDVIRPVGEREGQQIYVAEKIVGKTKKGNRIFYEVKWSGFSSEHNTF